MKTILFLIAACLYAEEVKAPEITTAQQLDYRRAQVKMLEAQAEYQGVITSLQKTCGERSVITDAKGDPICSKEVQK